MTDPLVIRINEILSEDAFRYVSRKLKHDNPNIIVLPSYCEVLHPQIIRCKDCKYYTGYECIRAKVSNIRVITDENEYCSRAERKG